VTATPFWCDDSLDAHAWDFCWLHGELLPGVVVSLDCPNKRGLDEQRSPGKDGVVLKDTGYLLSTVVVKFRIWTAEQDAAWQTLRQKIDPKLAGTRSPGPILHPKTTRAGVNTVYVESVEEGDPSPVSGMIVTISAREWTAKTKLAKVSATVKRQAAPTPHGSERPPIEVNTFG
jgi:hypothetical protein